MEYFECLIGIISRNNYTHSDTHIECIEHITFGNISGLCDEITVLNFGTVLCQGKVDDALNDPEVVKAYIGG